MTESYPLQWPLGRERTPEHQRKHGNLNKMPSGRIRQLLLDELRKMKVTNYVISSNLATRNDGLPYAGQRQPDDTGVVLYFTRKEQEIAIACDAWHSIDANLRAIGLTIEAIRGMERWGTEEMVDRAFTGFAALPANASAVATSRSWYEVLGVSQDAPPEVIRAAYRALSKTAHPDGGGTEATWAALQKAYQESGAA